MPTSIPCPERSRQKAVTPFSKSGNDGGLGVHGRDPAHHGR
jgi:hypothetical protein